MGSLPFTLSRGDGRFGWRGQSACQRKSRAVISPSP